MRRLTWAIICVVGGFLASAAAFAQQGQADIPVPHFDPGPPGQASYKLDAGAAGAIQLIRRTDRARTGRVWIRETGHSIRVIGEVDGAPPVWPNTPAEILSTDHVEVWVASANDVELPPIGWGDQFGMHSLGSDNDCANFTSPHGPSEDAAAQKSCRDWYRTQEDYRRLFKQLFVRQWLMGGNVVEETFATPAYESITKEYGIKDLAALEPRGKVEFHAVTHAGKPGYTFEIDIPYSALPPMNSLEMSQMRFMVDIFSAAPAGRKEGAFSTSSAARAFGKPETFNLLKFEQPHEFQLTPCETKLEGTDAYGQIHPAWFILKQSPQDAYQQDTFLVVNEAHGYQYEPGDTISPTIRNIHFFWRQIAAQEWACGPQLVYRAHGVTHAFDTEVSEEGFDARRAADGRVLIKDGPEVWFSEFGSGQCGACPRMKLSIHALDQDLNLISIFDLFETVGGPPGPSSGDLVVSPDWTRIVKYEQVTMDDAGSWTATSYCLGAGVYQPCGIQENVKPPDPPVLRLKIDGDGS
jgi:hypothetical protein